MSNGDWSTPPDELILPPTAGSTDARLVLGPDIPPELVAFYGTGATGLAWAIVGYFPGGVNYWYIAGSSSGTHNRVYEGEYVAPTVRELLARDIIAGSVRALLYGDLVGSSSDPLREQHQVTQAGSTNPGNAAAYSFVNYGALDVLLDNSAGAFLYTSQPRGLIAKFISTGSTGAIGAEAIAMTSSGGTYLNGRAFECRFSAGYQPDATGRTALFQLRKTNLAGAIITGPFRCPPINGTLANQLDLSFRFVNTSGADIIGLVIVLTYALGAGTITQTGSVATPRTMLIYDIGTAGDFAGLPSL